MCSSASEKVQRVLLWTPCWVLFVSCACAPMPAVPTALMAPPATTTARSGGNTMLTLLNFACRLNALWASRTVHL
eukprot:365870-Amphidinium_carterae.1